MQGWQSRGCFCQNELTVREKPGKHCRAGNGNVWRIERSLSFLCIRSTMTIRKAAEGKNCCLLLDEFQTSIAMEELRGNSAAEGTVRALVCLYLFDALSSFPFYSFEDDVAS